MRKTSLKLIIILGLALLITGLLAACSGPAATEAPDAAVPATEDDCPTAEPCPMAEESAVEIPFLALWEEAGHSDAEAEAFVHWDEDDPAVVATSCAKCHSTSGFQDFLGVDGSKAGVVDLAPEVGEVISCVACHNEATVSMDTVSFPHMIENEDGEMVPVTVSDLGAEAVCMNCHQGRASTFTVNSVIEEAAVADEDTPSEDLGFINIHYFAAAATRYGTLVKGGYEYEGKSYDGLFGHAEDITSCTSCHDQHSLELKIETCTECHTDVASVEDLSNIRLQGSLKDYDGDGSIDEGIKAEIEGLQEMLYTAMQAYGSEVVGSAIGYNAAAYPYFFVDSNEDGEISEDEAAFDNAYASWTPRLVKAAYNFQVAGKDPGGFAHGGKYLIELLYDLIEDLNTALSSPVDLSTAHRIDAGHFAGSEEAFRHWDEDGEVEAECAKCHSAVGLPQYLEYGTTVGAPLSNGLQCETCHNDLVEFTFYETGPVEFPSGATLGFEGDPAANLCLNCHQGRQSTASVNASIADLDLDTVSDEIGFTSVNIHYFAAGATLFGSQAHGVYEYEGKSYAGQFQHVPDYNTCTDCHSAHALEVDDASCNVCHSTEDPATIRMDSEGDYDGDGDVEEGIHDELIGLQEKLYEAIQTYAAEVSGTPIIYDSHAYPYFFIDSDGNGEVDGGEAIFPNQYNAWTPRLVLAAYNYQYAQKDPGAYVHNGLYVIQGLYDSIQDLSTQTTIDMSGMVRPVVEAPVE